MKRWPNKPLGELLKVQNGFAFKSELFNEDGKGLPIIRIRDLARGFSETFYDGEHDPAFEVENGDFLIGMDGKFHCYRWQGGKALLNQRVCRLQNFSRDRNAGFVFYGINDHLREIEDNTAFVTVKHLSSKQIASIEMSVPPLAEQERIVKLLDEADELRKLRAQADRRTADLVPSLFHEMFGDPALNSKNFPVKLLHEVAFFQEGPGVRKWQFRSSGIKLINVGNIVEGQINLSRTERYLDKDEVETTYKHFLLNAGDLVMATSGATWGKVAVVEAHHLPLCMNTSVVRFRPLTPEICHSLFLRGFFESKSFRRQIKKLITGSAQPNFGPSHLKQIRLPIPPLSLQKEFAARVSEIRAVQAEQSAGRHRLENLFESMLHRAFQGEL